MPKPSSKMKIKKDGVTFESNVDAVQWTITELTRAALYDTAKIIRKRTLDKIRTLPGMGYPNPWPPRMLQYWVRKREGDLQIGFGKTKGKYTGSGDVWYAIRQEIGSSGRIVSGKQVKMPKKGFLRNTVFENIDEIRKAQAKYLSAITDDTADALINEDDYESPDREE